MLNHICTIISYIVSRALNMSIYFITFGICLSLHPSLLTYISHTLQHISVLHCKILITSSILGILSPSFIQWLKCLFCLTALQFHLLWIYAPKCVSNIFIKKHLIATFVSKHAVSHLPWDRLRIIFGFRIHLLYLLLDQRSCLCQQIT